MYSIVEQYGSEESAQMQMRRLASANAASLPKVWMQMKTQTEIV